MIDPTRLSTRANTGASRMLIVLACLLGLSAAVNRAAAQAPINSNVALQPSRGGVIIRQQFRYAEADLTTPTTTLDFRLLTSSTTIVYGVTDAFTVLINQPIVLSRRVRSSATGSSDVDAGAADTTILGKYRIYRNDFGPARTARFDLIGGAELPTGADAFSGDSINPIIGGVFTITDGRHAFSADLLWKQNTGDGPNLLRYDAAYSLRLAPERYTSPNPTALFGVIELNGFSQSNGDQELFLSPGIQYVTTRWIAEATVQIPIWQSLDHRPERDFVIGLSVRFQF